LPNFKKYDIYGIMIWTIELLNDDVLNELNALPSDQKAKFTRIADIIKEFGLENVREPYVKHLEKGLWEIRMKGRDGIFRAFYVVAKPKRIVVVRVFKKKTQKTPRKEIKLALKRAEEIK
jgi:phage-related protein